MKSEEIRRRSAGASIVVCCDGEFDSEVGLIWRIAPGKKPLALVAVLPSPAKLGVEYLVQGVADEDERQ
jgi:hypothetical protein